MPRPLNEIIAQIRAVSADPSISTTLIQTEDLMALCDAAEGGDPVSEKEKFYRFLERALGPRDHT